MAEAQVIDFQRLTYERIMKNRQVYFQPIMRVFGYFLMIGADNWDDVKTDIKMLKWIEHFPDLATLSAAEQDTIFDGALQLLSWFDAPIVLRQIVEAWFAEGATHA